MKLIIDIPEEMYLNAKADILCGGDILVKAIKNGTPQETVTEFADRCRECGAKYGKLLKQKLSGDLISREAVLDTISELNAISFYEAQEDSKECYYELRQAIKDLPSVKPQEPKTEWIPIEWEPFGKNGYPKPEDEYKHFLTIDDKGEITIQEFLLSLDEEPQPYFTGMRKIIAWMPLPKPYEPQEGSKE